MAYHNRPARLVSVRLIGALAFYIALANAAPDAILVEFSPPGHNACAVASPDPAFFVSIRTDPAPLAKANRITSGRKTALVFAGQDNVTRLCFFETPEKTADTAGLWVKRFGGGVPENLRAITDTKAIPCRFEKWVTRVGDKVLPLGLLSVSFRENLPPPGTPLVNADGKIVALIFQPAGPNAAYAIPAQAVHRVLRDATGQGRLVRASIGFTLSTDSSVPRITRVLPDSPAAKAGLRPDDILLQVGAYPTEGYPDAVNALFYTIPGEATSFVLSRGNERIERKLIPPAR
jgi:membrane-associated protease RseP (regulator of RpoE activity)